MPAHTLPSSASAPRTAPSRFACSSARPIARRTAAASPLAPPPSGVRRSNTSRASRCVSKRYRIILPSAVAPRGEDGVVEQEVAEAAGFNWERCWYPVARLADLAEDRPNALEVLGKLLVCWRDKDDEWRVADDACSHKLAPLSLGKVTKGGDLMCRYHGYCFNGAGECTRVPMAVSKTSEATACRLPQSHIVSYPVTVSQGLLWVWPDSSPARWLDSQMQVPPADSSVKSDYRMSDVPIDFTMFLENAHDPCHANFLHEGLGFGANKYSPDSAVPMKEFKLDGKLSSRGFVLRHGGYSQATDGQLATRTFTAPVTADTTYVNSRSAMQTRIHFVPVRPGFTRFFASFQFGLPTQEQKAELEAARDEGSAGQGQGTLNHPKPSPLAKLRMMAGFVLPRLLMKVFPKYVGEAFTHMASSKLGDQDNLIMAGTERYMQRRNQVRPMGDWAKEYALLTPSDQGIVAFRRWLDKFAGGGPWAGAMPYHSKEVTQAHLLDRWNSHTKHCHSCRSTLSLFDKLSHACSNLAIVLGVAALVSMGLLHGATSQIPCVLAVLAVLSHAAHLKFRFAQRRFISGLPGAGDGLPELDPWAGYH